MGKPSAAILKFMETYGVDSDEIWEVHGSQWVIKHKALERIAAEKGIVWDRPAIIEHDAANQIAVICVFAKLGERTEWSIGEASPKNNRNAYPYAIAEKRGKDRCVLKLLAAHGGLYSDSEADDFADKRENPHVNKPADFVEPTEYDQHGQPVDNIPLGDRQVTKLTKATARSDFGKAQEELRACKSVTALQLWGSVNANRVSSYPADWQELMRGIYGDHLHDLRKTNGNGKAA